MRYQFREFIFAHVRQPQVGYVVVGYCPKSVGGAAYESVLSQLLAAVAGKGIFYGIRILSIVLVLCVSANTSFVDFLGFAGR